MSTIDTIEKLTCTHCGDTCEEETITSGDAVFCCTGCHTVYDLLNESGLGTYYDIEEEAPGISMKKVAQMKRFEHLDDPSVQHKLLDYTDGKVANVTFKTPQIHCSSCIWLLENLHRLNPAVRKSEVFFGRREASISFNIQKLPLSELAALLTSIGYEPDLSLDKLDQKHEAPSNRPLYLKIGIAGFAFGNIMLFSLPEYLSGPGGLDRQFLTLFGALNIILALPVFLYSSLDFYRPAITSIRQRQWSMDIAISIGIIAMFGRSLYEILSGYGVGYMDSFTMLVFLLLVGRLFQKKTFDTLSFERDFKSYFPLSVTRLINNSEQSVAATQLEKEDVVLIRNGELLPADSILMDAETSMDFSFVTGEFNPVTVRKGELVYAGGRNKGTAARFKLVNPVSGSYLTRLWNNEEFRKPKEETLRSLSQNFSRYFSPAVLSIATLAALYWLPSSPATAINAFTAVLIIACPCALALSAPFTLGWATNILSRNKLYLKNGETTEHLATIDSIVFDKTGTLTIRNDAQVEFIGRELTDHEKRLLFKLLHQNTHPVGRAVYHHLDSLKTPANGKLYEIKDYKEFSGKGIEARIDNDILRIGSAKFIGAGQTHDKASGSLMYVSINGEVPGYFSINSLYREGLRELLTNLKKSAETWLLSGDNEKEKDALLPCFNNENHLIFNQSPEDKLEFVKKLQNSGKHVLMIGDGLNDAGALKASTVGVSIAEDTSSFTPASDVIMDAGSLSYLDRVLAFSKKSVRIIHISFAISVLYNVIGLAYAVTGTLSPLICAIIMPVSSVSVILFTTLATHYSAWKRGLKI